MATPHSAAYSAFRSNVLAPGVLRYGRRKIDVGRLGQVDPDLLRCMDEANNEGLREIEARSPRRSSVKVRAATAAGSAPWDSDSVADILHGLQLMLSDSRFANDPAHKPLALKLLAALDERCAQAASRGEIWK